MKINLIPISHQELGTIEIDSDEFIIGRMEEPFVTAATEITASMSRKHARIYLENDHYLLVDTGSTNGTKVNNSVVEEQGVLLQQDDVIEFGGNLSFKVEIIDNKMDATVLMPKGGDELILEPINKQSGLDILVISGFPFLISKEAGIFTSFLQDFAEPMQRISRRHAYITLEQGRFLLTDMDSTNGTFVNNQRIVEPGTPLQHGDIISFGGDFFSYVVKLGTADEEPQNDPNATMLQPSIDPDITADGEQAVAEAIEARIEPEIAPEHFDEPRTTFVNDPSPFLDILCAEDRSETVDDPDTFKNESGHPSSHENEKELGFFAKKFVFIRQLGNVWKTGKSSGEKKRWPYALFGIFIIAVAGVAFHYLYNRTERLQELIKAENYEKAAELSIDLLQEDPENVELKNLSFKAIMNWVIPQWLDNVENNDFQRNEQLLQEALQQFQANPDMDKALKLLLWNNSLYQFKSTRDSQTKVIIFQNEQQLNALVSGWLSNKKENELTLALVSRDVPAYSNRYNETLSFIRTLEHDQDIYLSAIDKLTTKLKSLLNQGQTDSMLTEIALFEKKYAAVGGLDAIKLDIHRYADMDQALKSKDIDLINKMRQEIEFRTPIFQAYAKQSLANELPSNEFIDQYQAAVNAWQKGEIETAINGLFALSEDPWGSAAISKLKRYQSILDQYNDLNRNRNNKAYLDKLFAFHALLQPPEDDFFLKSIEDDFLKNKKQATANIQKHVDTALSAWDSYRDNGGIGGLMRLENKVSELYRKQARRLSTAYQNIEYAKQLYSQLGLLNNSQWNSAYAAITDEMDKQKKWLQDLELILKPTVLKQKLDLLNSSKRQTS